MKPTLSNNLGATGEGDRPCLAWNLGETKHSKEYDEKKEGGREKTGGRSLTFPSTAQGSVGKVTKLGGDGQSRKASRPGRHENMTRVESRGFEGHLPSLIE